MHAAADFRRDADAFLPFNVHGERGDATFAHHFHFALDRLFNVLRIEVVPAHDQHVFQAPGDEQLTGAHEAQVAGAQPGAAGVLDEGLGGRFRVAPVAVGDARAASPDFADGVVGQFVERAGIDDQYSVIRLADAAAHDRAALARLDPVLRQRLIVHPQVANTLTARAAGDEQRAFGQTIGRHETVRGKTARRELLGKAFQRVEANRFGAGIRHAPTAQVEALQGRFADPFAAQPIGKIRPAADGAAVLADRLQPAQRPCEEVGRRHQHAGHTAENRLQQTADQPHVVVQRQPADDHVVRVQIDTEAVANQQLVRHQVAMADLHTFGQGGGAGGVLQEGDVVVLQVRRDPTLGQGAVEGIDAQQRRRAFDLRQRIAQIGAGQQQTRFGIADDRQQAFLMMTTGRLRRISRHRDHTGVQATEKCRDVIRATGEQQHRAIAKISLGLQGAGNDARSLVQFAITEHHSLILGFGEKTQGHPVRRQGRAALEGLDQCAGEFERVGHGVSCLNSAVGASLLAKNRRTPRGVRCPSSLLTTFASELAPTGL
ncbi:hypothetical protein PS639_01031 [Pseudomonas fluorescens]|nr:hypothetical protein PS639_01031 [Pseudomonas fluorescens]